MQARSAGTGMLLVVAVLLAGCGRQAAFTGPDEFQVLPGKPLQTPANLSHLPTPTPNGTNLADTSPRQQAVAALGGNPSALRVQQVPAADAGLVRYAGRHGVAPGVRAELARADKAFRGRRSLLGRITPKRYLRIYRAQTLDAERELARLRAAGVQTPAAPPAGN